MLTSNDVKDIVKVIRSFENKEALLKGTTRIITIPEGACLNFIKPLTLVGLLLMKNVLIPLAKSILVSLALTVAVSVRDASMKKKIVG